MTYANNEMKLAAVVSSKHEIPVVMNGMVHAVAGLLSVLDADALAPQDYVNEGLGIEAKISRYPNIVLKAKNGSQLKRLYDVARSEAIPVNLFAGAMLGSSSEEQVRQLRNATDETLDPMVVVLFGKASDLSPLTKKFSLFRV